MMEATIEAAPPRRGARLYFGATTVAQACALLRYVALARLLGPEQLGLAATLMLTASFFELVMDTSADRFLIQARDGDQPQVQGLVQLVGVGRGIVIAGLFAMVAWPISQLYHAPQLVGGLLALSLSPLIAGFGHVDTKRIQRRLDFRTEGWALLVSETVGFVATVIAALATRSFIAVIYGIVLRTAAAVAVTHIRSERRFTIGLDRAHLAELARFSAPLMLNGLLLFMGSQSDRVMVGSLLSLKDLGLYSAVILLIYYPSSTLLRYLQAMYLPLVSSGRTMARRSEAADLLGGQSILLAMSMEAGFLATMPFVVPLIYGERYNQSLLTFALIGVLQSSRFLILWPNTVATGDGRSAVVLAANIVRMIALPAGIVGAWFTGRLEGLLAGFILGEWAAVASGLVMTRGLSGRSPGSVERFGAFIGCSILVVAWAAALEAQAGQVQKVLTVASVILAWWILQREHATMRRSLQLLRQFKFRAARPEPAAAPRIEGASDLP
jgi:O-antigen/teichoic acid export membrane protein